MCPAQADPPEHSMTEATLLHSRGWAICGGQDEHSEKFRAARLAIPMTFLLAPPAK